MVGVGASALRLGAAVLVVFTSVGGVRAQVSSGESRTGREVAELARRALEDPAALEELRRVEVVDGRRRRIGDALEGAEGEDLRARLRQLSRSQDSGGFSPLTPQAAREGASAPEPAPGQQGEPSRPSPDGSRREPSSGLLERLLQWPVLVGLAAIIAVIVLARRVTRGVARPADDAETPREDAAARRTALADLEEAVRRAERDRDFELAVRLLFQAGLTRLATAGRIPAGSTTPNGTIRATLRSRTFDELALAFDRVAYGQQPAREEDLVGARAGWAVVLQ